MPSKIVFFQDGVSEGQFDAVLREEVSALRRACERIKQKRKAATSGTTADTTVVSSLDFVFYMCSYGSNIVSNFLFWESVRH